MLKSLSYNNIKVKFNIPLIEISILQLKTILLGTQK